MSANSYQKVKNLWRGAMVVFVFAVLMVPGVGVSAQSSGNVGLRVANPDPSNPRSRSIFIYTLAPTESKQDQLLIINPTDEPQNVLLASVDGVVTNTGSYTCKMEAEPVEDSGNWVSLSKTELTIPAKSEERVDFTVAVPAQTAVGEHNSCLTLRAVDEVPEEKGGGVRLRTRQAIRMITTIPGDLKRDIGIDQFSVERDGIKILYSMTIGNRGNVSADIDMRIRLLNMLGKEVAATGGEYPVIPGETLAQQFSSRFEPLFGGWYKALPSARFDKRLGAFGTESETAEYEIIYGAPKNIFLWPTTTGWSMLIGVLALVLLVAWKVFGNATRQRKLKKTAVLYKVKKEDTIQSLAKNSVNWQTLARLNKIKAPYTLEPGQELLLPNSQNEDKKHSKKGQIHEEKNN